MRGENAVQASVSRLSLLALGSVFTRKTWTSTTWK